MVVVLGCYFLIAVGMTVYHAVVKAEYVDTAAFKGALWGWFAAKWVLDRIKTLS